MAPKVKITRKMIIDEAAQLVCEEGYEQLNARSLAARLKCSVQPIFRNFSSMEELKEVVVRKVGEDYQNYLRNSMSEEEHLVGLVFAYVNYAREEKNFFKLLHMSDRLNLEQTSQFADVGINRQIVEFIAQMMKLTYAEASLLYRSTFFTAHGIASMVATNQCDFSDEEIKTILDSVFEGVCTNIMKNRENTGDC